MIEFLTNNFLWMLSSYKNIFSSLVVLIEGEENTFVQDSPNKNSN